MSGQTLTDRIAAAQYQLTGSDMARAVCKATTHEVMAPKKKHLECEYEYCHPPFRQAGRPFFFFAACRAAVNGLVQTLLTSKDDLARIMAKGIE